MVDLVNISETFSSRALNIPDNLMAKISPWISNSLGDPAQWILTFFAAIVSTIVAVNIERKFRDKKRINSFHLLKKTFLETFEVMVAMVVSGFVILALIGLFFLVIEYLRKLSSTLALIVGILVIGSIVYVKKTEKEKTSGTT